MEDRERIEQALKARGWVVEKWREAGADGRLEAVVNPGRFVVIEADDSNGLYEGDEGELSATVVGAERFGNQRVAFTFTPDDYEPGEGNEVSDLSLLDPAPVL